MRQNVLNYEKAQEGSAGNCEGNVTTPTAAVWLSSERMSGPYHMENLLVLNAQAVRFEEIFSSNVSYRIDVYFVIPIVLQNIHVKCSATTALTVPMHNQVFPV